MCNVEANLPTEAEENVNSSTWMPRDLSRCIEPTAWNGSYTTRAPRYVLAASAGHSSTRCSSTGAPGSPCHACIRSRTTVAETAVLRCCQPCSPRSAHSRLSKIVQTRLGHANIGITMDTDSHVTPGQDLDAARLVASLVSAAA